MTTLSLPSFVCPICKSISYNPTDIHEGYCRYCHAWTTEKLFDIAEKQPPAVPDD